MGTFNLGAGADTVKFASIASANGEDTITSFTAGTSADVLDFTATGVKKGTVTIDGSGDLTATDGIAVISVEDKNSLTFVASTPGAANAGEVSLADAGKYIIITDVDDDGKAGNIYLVTAASDDDTSPTVELLGTVMRADDSVAWDADNLAGAA